MQHHLPALPKPQQKTLAFFATTLLQTQSVQQTKIARCPLAPTEATLASRERRFQRFLATAQRGHEAVQQQWAKWVLSCLPQRDSPERDSPERDSPERDSAVAPLVLLVDETSLQEHVRVMAVCLAWQGRAIPLVWKAYPAQAERCQTQIILSLLDVVRAVVPVGQVVLVEADRGIGGSPTLLSGIAKQGWFYLVRVMNSVRVRWTPDGVEVPIGSLLCQAGDTISLTFGEAFKKFGWLSCGILGCYEEGHKDGWCLVTNYPYATCRGYALRMWVEACFKDLKSGSWNWQNSRVRCASRVERLWLVMALATLFACVLGSVASATPSLRRLVSRGSVRRESYLQWGIALLICWLAYGTGKLGKAKRQRGEAPAILGKPWALLPGLPQNPFRNDSLPDHPQKTVVQ